MLPLILMLVIMQPGRTFVRFAARTQFHIRLSGVYRPIALCLWFATMVPRAGEGAEAPVSPNERIPLFNGKDLGGFYTWLVDSKREDPRHVFVVTNGVIRISGEGLGYLATEKEYQDYHLVAEFKWGKTNWPWGGRTGKARDTERFRDAGGFQRI